MFIFREVVLVVLILILILVESQGKEVPLWLSWIGIAMGIGFAVTGMGGADWTWSHATLGMVAAYLFGGILMVIPGMNTLFTEALPGPEGYKTKLTAKDYGVFAALGAFATPLAFFPVFFLAIISARLFRLFSSGRPLSLHLGLAGLLVRYLGTAVWGNYFGI
ncbi:MAG: hypothetical protein QF492_05865 [Candidatus Krumholzibacteria bacterium]|jgi:hypothetical protein|nr:hypothetical protein [Candidatus Krumholzibacteria bacterium]MDP6669413.1 hypothetical protein [Candidatus Krumholzibacteria bacterium]MDP6798015.1 hypothetical protein [Candidatus Krumholzibacteria bacterium]MDP7021538.1 hypothetical protein [Candidatus Krumholzibacteria bacterium]